MFWSLLIMTIIAIAGGASLGIEQVDDGIDAWESAVKKVVVDKDQKKAAVEFVDQVRKETVERRKHLADALSAYLKLEAAYDASQEEIDQAIITLNTVWTGEERWLYNKRAELQKMLSSDEWEEALALVNKDLEGHWDALKKSQKKARETYEKFLSKAN